MSRRLLVRLLACAALFGVAGAQYYPYGQPYDPNMWNYYYGYPGMTGGGGIDDILGNLQAQNDYYMNQMDQIGLAIQAQLAEYDRYFIGLYRSATGDTTSPDAYALEMGKQIHCQRNPLDCQLALQGAQSSLAARQASFDAWFAGVQQKDAANDAAFNAWMQGQADQQAAHDAYVRGAILGVGEYTNPETGTGYYLPYAPGQGTYYQTPTGLPLVFDQSRNTWYQVEVDGTYTPYYEVP